MAIRWRAEIKKVGFMAYEIYYKLYSKNMPRQLTHPITDYALTRWTAERKAKSMVSRLNREDSYTVE